MKTLGYIVGWFVGYIFLSVYPFRWLRCLLWVSHIHIFLWRCRWLGVRWYTPLAIRIHTKYILFRMGWIVVPGIFMYTMFLLLMYKHVYLMWCIYSTSLHCIYFENLYGYKHTHRISYIKHKIRKLYVWMFLSEKYMYCESGNSIIKTFSDISPLSQVCTVCVRP